MVDGKREFALLKEIGFVRMGATAAEDRAADILISRLKEAGVTAEKEYFSTVRSNVKKASFEVLEPYQKEYTVRGFRNAKATPEEGIVCDVFYAPDDKPVTLKKGKGKIILHDSYVGIAGHTKLKNMEAAGFVATASNSNVYIPNEYQDLDEGEFRSKFIGVYDLPGVNVMSKDLMEMVERGASKARLTLLQEEGNADSCNVVAHIKGTEGKEAIVFTAHYDSVEFSNGVYDNGSGSVCLYELAAYFAKHQPRADLIFVWCGCEERGLLGSRAYVEAHKEELDRISLCINVDMIGTIMGHAEAICTADDSLASYIDYLGKEVGYSIYSHKGVYSSDSTPFADAGVPAVSFARETTQNFGPVHCRYDRIEHMSEKNLAEDTEFICLFAKMMADAFIIPVPRKMPQDMLEELDEYNGRAPLNKLK